MRGLARETANLIGFHHGHRDDIDRLTRVLEAALSTSDRGPDPYLVADTLESLESRDKPWDSLETVLTLIRDRNPVDTVWVTISAGARIIAIAEMLACMFTGADPHYVAPEGFHDNEEKGEYQTVSMG